MRTGVPEVIVLEARAAARAAFDSYNLKIGLVYSQPVHAWHKPGINLGIKYQHKVVT